MVFEKRNYEDIVNNIVAYLIENNDSITDLNVGSVIRSLIEAYALELDSETYKGLYQQIQEVYNATRITTATGNDLDELLKLIGLQRKQGTKSSVTITAMRTTPATNDFVIPKNSIFGTEPVTNEEMLRFLSLDDNTFKANITNEEHTFKDGIYRYPLTERFYDNVSDIIGTINGVDTNLIKGTDYVEAKGINEKFSYIDTIQVLDNCEDVTGWNNSTDADTLQLDNVNYKNGSNSFKLIKSGTLTNEAYWDKTYGTTLDLTNKELGFWLYIKDVTIIDKINSIKIYLGSDSSNYIINTVTNLQDGWNFIYLNPSKATTVNSPYLTNINYIRILIETKTNNDLINDGDINIDYITFSETYDYEGDIIEFATKLDNDSIFKVSYVPLSKEVACASEDVGTKYNVAKGNITYLVSNLPDISSVKNFIDAKDGEDVETDDQLRERALNASFAIGKATVESIKAGLESLNFISSVSVEDLPKDQRIDTFTYDINTSKYQLQREIAIIDDLTKVIVTNPTTILTNDIDDVQTTITLDDTSFLNAPGKIIIDNEVIYYNAISGNDLTGCVRGYNNTTASNHVAGTTIYKWYKPYDDYRFTELSEIEWLNDVPNDTEEFSVYYTYKWLGHMNIFINASTNLTTEQQQQIEDKIMEYKAAGVSYTWTTPTIINVNVTCSIKPDDGYSFEELQPKVEEAIRNKLNSYPVGENVYISQLIDEIMNVEGVKYVHITTPTNDVEIAINEIVKSGTIIVNNI